MQRVDSAVTLGGVSSSESPTASRWVLHVDLDQFIAAVEVLRRPALRSKPVVVGGRGDPTERGVVSTASYEAREFGVHSGMPLRTAARMCPDAVFLAVDAPAYEEASTHVMATLRDLADALEVAGWDEAYLETHADDPEVFARRIQRAVRDATGLECTIGIGDNKLRAKIAAGFGKPAGVYRLTASTWHQEMDERPTEALFGIGRKTARKLGELGIRTVGELASVGEQRLARAFGPSTSPWLRRLAHGIDDSPIRTEPWRPRSRGRETTYQTDLTESDEIRREVIRLAREATADVVEEQRPVRRVVVKVRFAPFFTSTHGVGLDPPGLGAGRIVESALAGLERFELDRPVRLLGVRLELSDED